LSRRRRPSQENDMSKPLKLFVVFFVAVVLGALGMWWFIH
jgi:hypothetical protein